MVKISYYPVKKQLKMKKTIIKREELTKNDFSENTTIPSCFLRKTALSEKLFSRNKANFEKLRINTSTCMRKAYSNLPPKPTKPQSQLKPISRRNPVCKNIQLHNKAEKGDFTDRNKKSGR